MTNLEKVEAIISWSHGEDFDPSFVTSLHKQLLGGRLLSDAQEAGLENIIEKYQIEVEEWADV